MMFPKPEKRKKQNKNGQWAKVRDNELVPQFREWGIFSCEIKLEGCTGVLYTGFAHTKKRGDIHTPEDLRRVVLACSECHSKVEYFCMEYTGMTMTEFLDTVITRRNA